MIINGIEHEQDWCEHEMSQCAGGCPPYGYCTSESHFRKAELSPDWPCEDVLRALGQTREEWIAEHDKLLDAEIAYYESLSNGR